MFNFLLEGVSMILAQYTALWCHNMPAHNLSYYYAGIYDEGLFPLVPPYHVTSVRYICIYIM